MLALVRGRELTPEILSNMLRKPWNRDFGIKNMRAKENHIMSEKSNRK